MDWVPVWDWGQPRLISANTFSDLDLVDESIFGAASVMGRIEESSRWFIHRIVGQYQLWYDDTPANPELPVTLRVWPGFYDQTAGRFESPGNPQVAVNANARFWWERHRLVNIAPSNDLDTFSHPWWTTIDVRPKQVCDMNLMPVLTIRNPEQFVDLWVTLWWRMLVSPLNA